MQYRLVRLDDKSQNYGQIFNEETSELLGSVLKTRRLIFFRQYQLRIDDTIFHLNRSLISGRKWGVNDTAKVSFSLLGNNVRIDLNNGERILGEGFKRGKMTLMTETKRTVAVIDPDALKSKEMIIIEDYEKIDRMVLLGTVVLILERYKQW